MIRRVNWGAGKEIGCERLWTVVGHAKIFDILQRAESQPAIQSTGDYRSLFACLDLYPRCHTLPVLSSSTE